MAWPNGCPCSSTATRASTMRWRCSTRAASPEAEIARRHAACPATSSSRTSSATRSRCSSWPGGPTSRSRSARTARSCGRFAIAPETHGPHGLGYAVPGAAALGTERPDRRGPHRRGHARATGRGHARHARARSRTSRSRSCATRSCPQRVRGLVMMVGAVPDGRATRRPTTEWNARSTPRRSRSSSTAWTRAAGVRRVRGAPGRARPRRHRAREDDAASTSSGSPRAAADADGRVVALRRATRCASTSSSTAATTASTAPSSTTRWRSRSRSTRRWGGARRSTVEVELGGPAHGRRDRDGLATRLGPASRTSTSSSRPTSRRSSSASSSASARWPLPDGLMRSRVSMRPTWLRVGGRGGHAGRRRRSSRLALLPDLRRTGRCGSPGRSWRVIAVPAAIGAYALVEHQQTGRLDSIARQFDTRTLVLMPVAIAINIVLGMAVASAAQDPALPRLGRHDPRRRARRARWRAPRPASCPPWSGPTSSPPPLQSPYAAPFAIVAAVIGLLAGTFARHGAGSVRVPATPTRQLVVGAAIAIGAIVLMAVPRAARLAGDRRGDAALARERPAALPRARAGSRILAVAGTIVGLARAPRARSRPRGRLRRRGRRRTGIVAAFIAAPDRGDRLRRRDRLGHRPARRGLPPGRRGHQRGRARPEPHLRPDRQGRRRTSSCSSSSRALPRRTDRAVPAGRGPAARVAGDRTERLDGRR